jgi:hypothetical protein
MKRQTILLLIASAFSVFELTALGINDPVLGAFSTISFPTNAGYRVTGKVSGTPNTHFIVTFFFTDVLNPSSVGEPFAETDVQTIPDHVALFEFIGPHILFQGPRITATATETDLDGNPVGPPSAFSKSVPIFSDGDNDGIDDDSVDLLPGEFSYGFSYGATQGEITAGNGLVNGLIVSIFKDSLVAPEAGHLLVSAIAQAAELEGVSAALNLLCSPFSLSLLNGTTVRDLHCGSVDVAVETGLVQIHLSPEVVVSVPGGAAASADEPTPGEFTIRTEAESTTPVIVQVLDPSGTEFVVTVPANAAIIVTEVAEGTTQIQNAPSSSGDPVVVESQGQQIVLNSGEVVAQLTSIGPAKVWVGLKNSDDVGIKFDLLAEVYVNGALAGSGQLNSVPGGSSGFNNAKLSTIPLTLTAPVVVGPESILSVKLFVRNACSGSGKNSGSARLWFGDGSANSRFDASIESPTTYYLRSGFALDTVAGSVRQFIDKAAGAKCSSFKEFGTWSVTLP